MIIDNKTIIENTSNKLTSVLEWLKTNIDENIKIQKKDSVITTFVESSYSHPILYISSNYIVINTTKIEDDVNFLEQIRNNKLLDNDSKLEKKIFNYLLTL
jgi:hypothetical protein